MSAVYPEWMSPMNKLDKIVENFSENLLLKYSNFIKKDILVV